VDRRGPDPVSDLMPLKPWNLRTAVSVDHHRYWRKRMFKQDDIKEHMEVLGSDGRHVGIVDHIEGSNQIKLTKNDEMAGGQHHLIPVDWIARVDQQVHLKKSAKDAKAQWKTAA
jgi:hypothetical protein